MPTPIKERGTVEIDRGSNRYAVLMAVDPDDTSIETVYGRVPYDKSVVHLCLTHLTNMRLIERVQRGVYRRLFGPVEEKS